MDIETNTAATETAAAQAPASFIDSISQDMRGEECLSTFKDVDGLAKSYINAQKMIGSSIRIPTEDAGTEQVTEFYNKLSSVKGVVRLPEEGDEEGTAQLYTALGRPVKAEDYSFGDDIENTFDPGLTTEFKSIAHGLGLNSTQAQGIADFQHTMMQQQGDHIEQYIETQEKVLKDKWGNGYKEKIAAANTILKEYEGIYPEAVRDLRNSPIQNNAAIIAMLADIGMSSHEEGSPSRSQRLADGSSYDSAQQYITDVNSNPDHPARNPEHPGYEAAHAKRQKMYNIIHQD